MAKKRFSFFVLILAISINPPVLRAKDTAEPVLYIALGDGNDVKTIAADPAAAGNKPYIVVATHGWIEKETWPEDLALAIKQKTEPNQWVAGWFDWREKADVINPTDAAKYARDRGAQILAEKILGLSKDFKHVHLIGHSAGSWLISEAAKTIAKQTDANFHLTFLDAYVPPFWDENELADFNDPNITCWAEHYFTRDITLGVTQKHLTYAYNVDITKADPDVADHKFAFSWYIATVTGQYRKDKQYEGKEFFCRQGNLEYGFGRGFEAGSKSWQISTSLPLGNKPLVIQKPHRALGAPLQNLFKKRKQ